MSKLTTVVRKLRGRSLAELRVRAAQALSAAGERAGLAASRGPLDGSELHRVLDAARAGADPGDAPALLDAFRRREAPRLFAAFDEPAATVAAVRAGWPGAEAATLDRAERAARGGFDVLGYRNLSYGDPIDWHVDPIAGKRAPRVHWSRVPYLDPAVVGDHKVIWEVNRHQHFVTLGQAYWLTGDERFPVAFAGHLSEWMAANPPKIGINWASNLEVAIRAISWIWALHFFRSSATLTPPLYARLLAYLDVSARHLERYLSTYFSPNTHLTGEALGLLYIGTVFPEFRDSERWRRVGWDTLAGQLDVQVRADGVYFEQASYYHRYTADFYLHAVMLRERNGHPVDARVHAKLGQLLDHLAYLIRPDGRIPLVGDDDGGRLVMLTGRHPADARATLAAGATLYDRADWAAIARGASEEVVWLMGPAGAARLASAPAAPSLASSRAFPAGGYFVMRDRWGEGASYALVDCGPHGTMNCGHAHADVLALELSVGGRPMLVDAGTYTYPGAERNPFREGAAHNTSTLDGESSSVPGTTFQWQTIAGATVRAWATDPDFDYFDGTHDGYARLPAPASVGRSVFYLKGRCWVVADRVESAAPHALRVHYHAVPGLAVELEARDSVVIGARGGDGARAGVDGPGLRIVVPSAAAGAAPAGTFAVSEGWVSPLYGAREAAAACVFELRTAPGGGEVVSFLLPLDGTEPGWQVKEEQARHGRIFALTRDGRAAGFVLRSSAGRASAGAVETNAAWAWVAPTLEAPDEFILIGGDRLLVAGDSLVHLQGPAGWVAGRRAEGEWHLRHGRLDPAARE